MAEIYGAVHMLRAAVIVLLIGLLPPHAWAGEPIVTPMPERQPTRCEHIEAQVGNEKRCLKLKDSFRDCPDCPEMVVVPAGQFTMGSPESERDHYDMEGPQHDVTVGKALAVGHFAVTRGEFATFVQETNHPTDNCVTFENGRIEERADRSFRNPGFTQDDRHPVVCVNWDDAKAFVVWLSKKTGKPYRLLSEAEREYVTRAGTTTRYSFGNDERALFRYGNVGDQTAKKSIKGAEKWPIADCDDGYAYTAPVGQFAPNQFGIHDAHGNVWDWTEDCWHKNYQGAPTDGSAWMSGNCSERVVRGGAWGYTPEYLRSDYRWAIPIAFRSWTGVSGWPER
jgi:formylglycine-generating enzyme required for sulfatase activity